MKNCSAHIGDAATTHFIIVDAVLHQQSENIFAYYNLFIIIYVLH